MIETESIIAIGLFIALLQVKQYLSGWDLEEIG